MRAQKLFIATRENFYSRFIADRFAHRAKIFCTRRDQKCVRGTESIKK